jgi:phage terminase large subunit-like protein
MGRPAKSLAAHVKDGSFRARRETHRALLPGPDLPWPAFASLQHAFRQASRERERRAIALEFERLVAQAQAELRRRRAGASAADSLSELGASGSAERVVAFFPRFLFHEMGPRAGERFTLEPFQEAFLREFFRRGSDGRRLYREGLLGLPRGNGKTPLAAGLGIYTLLSAEDAPQVLCAAGSKEQARVCLDFARSWAEGDELSSSLTASSSVIRLSERPGSFRVLSADGRLGHGLQPSAAIMDELWLLTSFRERQAYHAFTSALHKRTDAWLLSISTAGYDRSSLLGEIYTQALSLPDVEHSEDGCLTIARDPDSGFLLWWYGAPANADAEDEQVVRACNPASWLSSAELLRMLRSPGTDENEWRRLHLNQWTQSRDLWLPPGCWEQLRSECAIADGAEIYVAVDAALKYDTSALCWAARLEDGRIALQTRVWSCRAEAPHHVYVPGGRIENALVERFIAEELARRYRVVEVVYDPRYFDSQGARLEAAGLAVAEFPQQSELMANAYQHFYEAATAGQVVHDGDPVFARHVAGAAARVTERGWKVYKLRSSSPIDALVAAVMARERAARAAEEKKPPPPEIIWLD